MLFFVHLQTFLPLGIKTLYIFEKTLKEKERFAVFNMHLNPCLEDYERCFQLIAN